MARSFHEKLCRACLEAFTPTGPRALYCDRGECRATRRVRLHAEKLRMARASYARRVGKVRVASTWGIRPTHSDGSLETVDMEPQRCECGAELVISCPNGHV